MFFSVLVYVEKLNIDSWLVNQSKVDCHNGFKMVYGQEPPGQNPHGQYVGLLL